MKNNLHDLANVAQIIGKRSDYIQGGGGNVSIKMNDTDMLVKASGLRLSDLTSEHGLVKINYRPLREFYAETPVGRDLQDLIAENDLTVKENTVPDPNTGTALRPSIETGFHAILGTVVLHTHSVYANILTCTVEGKEIISKLFPEAVFVDYFTPGVALTHAIKNALGSGDAKILFLKNHGVIVVGDTAEEAHALHETVNDIIKVHLEIKSPYPTFNMSGSNGNFSSDITFLAEILDHDNDLLQSFPQTILFPDQVVYGDQVSFGDGENKHTVIDLRNKTLVSRTSEKEAWIILETLLAWAYIIMMSNKSGLHLNTISPSEGDFIANLDSEKYRKSII